MVMEFEPPITCDLFTCSLHNNNFESISYTVHLLKNTHHSPKKLKVGYGVHYKGLQYTLDQTLQVVKEIL